MQRSRRPLLESFTFSRERLVQYFHDLQYFQQCIYEDLILKPWESVCVSEYLIYLNNKGYNDTPARVVYDWERDYENLNYFPSRVRRFN